MNPLDTSGISYPVSAVDRLGPPEAFFSEERYLGYRVVDHAKPYAHFFRPAPLPLPSHVMTALQMPPVSSDRVTPLVDASREMARPGYLSLETGYGLGSDNMACIACLTDMPGVEPVMWQWWFGWHLAESARYKLWHPGAHVFAAPGRPVSDEARGVDADAHIGNVSYIDEYIGARLMRLAVRFTSPQLLGFAESSPDCVTIVGRGGPSHAPVTAVWLIHQVRRTARGCEMRSRFYIGPPQPMVGVGAAHSAMSGQPQPEPTPIDLLEHCGTEMNHLASFLPDLYREFSLAG